MEKNKFLYTLNRMGVKSAPKYEGAFNELFKMYISESMTKLAYQNNAFIAMIEKQV